MVIGVKLYLKRNIKILGISLAAFFILSVLYAGELYIAYVLRGREVDFITKVRYDLWAWMPWAFFVPIIIWLGQRFSLSRREWLIPVVIHSAASVFFPVLQSFITYVYIDIYCGGNDWNLSTFGTFLFGTFFLMIFTYWIIIAIVYIVEYQKKYREHELNTSQMEAKLAQAQMKNLKAQLQPHFLFNTLHTISGLMFKDVLSANKMIAQLSNLLRFSLDRTEEHEVELSKELEFVDLYLNIQKTRFKGKLDIVTEIESGTLNAKVPSLLLQPLVENAIVHGISPHKQAGEIKIISTIKDDMLKIEIHDNGKGMESKNIDGVLCGLGIKNTLERLKQLYQENYRFNLEDSDLGGLMVVVELPLMIE